MKITYRIPTQDQYAFVEIEDTCIENTPDPEMIRGRYDLLTSTFKDGVEPGLLAKDFNAFLDCYVTTGKPPEDGANLWEQMNQTQRVVINELKKSMKRMTK